MFFNVQNFHSLSSHTIQPHRSRQLFGVWPGSEITWEAVGWEVVWTLLDGFRWFPAVFVSKNQPKDQSQLKSSYVAEACWIFEDTPVLSSKLICSGVEPEQMGPLLCFFCHTQVMHGFVETSLWPLALALYDELHSRVLVKQYCDCCFAWFVEDVGELKLTSYWPKL